MKPILIFFTVTLLFCVTAIAQITIRKVTIDKDTRVTDSAGNAYSYEVWHPLMISGDYELRRWEPITETSGYKLLKLDSAAKARRLKNLPEPFPSPYFTTGQNIKSFTAKDISGNSFKLKELTGKIVVLNFWFIDCQPCRAEIPELNKIALEYAGDPNVVFIAIAIDYKSDIKKFLQNNPFNYHIIADGRDYADLYGIRSYPTNLVLDKEGKVRFHATGGFQNLPLWIKKTIGQLK